LFLAGADAAPDELDGHAAVELRLLCLVDDAHTTPAEDPFDDETGDAGELFGPRDPCRLLGRGKGLRRARRLLRGHALEQVLARGAPLDVGFRRRESRIAWRPLCVREPAEGFR